MSIKRLVRTCCLLLLVFANAYCLGQACCSITAIDPNNGVVSAKLNRSGEAFQFAVTNRNLLRSLRVGQPVYANFSARQVSLDGKSACCAITAGVRDPGAPAGLGSGVGRVPESTATVAPSAPSSLRVPTGASGSELPAVASVNFLKFFHLIRPLPGQQAPCCYGGEEVLGSVGLSAPAGRGGTTVHISLPQKPDPTGSSAASEAPRPTYPVPTSLTAVVPEGQTRSNFSFASLGVIASTQFTYSAATTSTPAYNATLTLLPAILSNMYVSPQSTVGGSAPLKGKVSLEGKVANANSNRIPPPPDAPKIDVALTSSSSAIVVPSSVQVLAGNNQANFELTSNPVVVDTPATISATYGGISKTVPVTVLAPRPKSLTPASASVSGGNPQQFELTLTGRAPADPGIVVQVSSSNSQVAVVPATLNFVNTDTKVFAASTAHVTSNQNVTITASYLGTTTTAKLQVSAPQLPDLTAHEEFYTDSSGYQTSPAPGASSFSFNLCFNPLNVGNAASAATTLRATMTPPGGATQTWDLSVAALNPGTGVTVCVVPDGSSLISVGAGTTTFTACINPDHNVSESNYQNNCLPLWSITLNGTN